MPNLATQMSDSASDFLNIVWPKIKDHIGGGRIIPVETVTDVGFAKTLDMMAGIDAWHILQNEMGMRGIASRVQWRFNRNGDEAKGSFGETGYPTFTIRSKLRSGKKTEWDKRTYALCAEGGAILYPYITSQAYLYKPGECFLSGAVIHTAELFNLAHANFHDIAETPVAGGNEMLIVTWELLKIWGAETLILIPGDYPNGQGDIFNESQ